LPVGRICDALRPPSRRRSDTGFPAAPPLFGRLTLNILLAFAQFERELIGERTRDKMSAARRKGKWVGGCPVLGYDVDPRGGRLVVNEDEAERVRAIFALFEEHRSMRVTLAEIERRGWRLKSWKPKTGPSNRVSSDDRLTSLLSVCADRP
jgi:DNA invertase Pin-like site-specific DNA recombinase